MSTPNSYFQLLEDGGDIIITKNPQNTRNYGNFQYYVAKSLWFKKHFLLHFLHETVWNFLKFLCIALFYLLLVISSISWYRYCSIFHTLFEFLFLNSIIRSFTSWYVIILRTFFIVSLLDFNNSIDLTYNIKLLHFLQVVVHLPQRIWIVGSSKTISIYLGNCLTTSKFVLVRLLLERKWEFEFVLV